MIVANDELTPSQIRNLEKATNATVVDRTVTKITYKYVNHAGSATGAGGGGFTSRGAGETKLEQSRRRITAQMVHIRQELADLEKGETTRSAQRQNNDLPNVALVGYTNAGKSTLMNRMLARFGIGASNDDSKQVFEKDMLFATLNTTLPHSLVAAFKSTLQEAASADLLLHVVDVSDPHYQDMMTTTNKTLQEIGVSGRPTITVYNKADRTELVFPEVTGENAITISALDIASQDALIDLIKQHVFKDVAVVNLHIPFDKGNVQAQLAAKHTFLQEDYDDTGTLITVELSTNEREILKIISFKKRAATQFWFAALLIFLAHRDDEI
ncbi:hypothetical protein Pfo_031500 [Paulownia fortunei]|nr:hypothetical protein Pfo_031500 [Paulownia fortunei]